MIKTGIILFVLVLLGCNDNTVIVEITDEDFRQDYPEKKDYGVYEDKENRKLYKCLDKYCNEKKLLLVNASKSGLLYTSHPYLYWDK